MFLLEEKWNVTFRVTRKTNVKPDLKYHYNIHYSNSLSFEYSIIGMFYYPYNMFHIICVYKSFIQHLFIAVIYITVFIPSIKNIKANSQNKISPHFNMNIYIGIVHGSIIISWKWKRIGLLVGVKCENIKRMKKHYFKFLISVKNNTQFL